MRKIVLVASERREFDGILRHLGSGEAVESPLRYARRIRGGEIEWLLCADGQGAKAAQRACSWVPQTDDLFAMGSVGYCGGTKPHWRVGDVLLAAEVIDSLSKESFSCWVPDLNGQNLPPAKILTVNRVIRQAAEKRKFGESDVDAVEMEAASVARAARAMGVSFFALKAVSDTCLEDLVFDFDRARRGDGSIRVGSVVAQALSRPWDRIPRLGSLARAAKQASESLGVALAALLPSGVELETVHHGNS